jgi:hypothetical protein
MLDTQCLEDQFNAKTLQCDQQGTAIRMYKGTQQAVKCVQIQTSPGEVGMLLAPPSAALLLILSFLAYRFTVGRSDFEK